MRGNAHSQVRILYRHGVAVIDLDFGYCAGTGAYVLNGLVYPMFYILMDIRRKCADRTG